VAGDHDERIQTITMPKWGLSMTTGKIVEWFVAEGDVLDKGDDVVDIDTDKIAGTLESSVAGPVRRLVAEVGDQLPIGAVLVVVAPEEVPDSEIDVVVAEAKEAAASGELDVPEEPQPQLVEIGGRTISYFTLTAEEPGGDPVVLVHGFGGDKNSWLFVQQPLAEHHAVHALDLPGHGASDKEVGDGSLASLADTVVGFLDALGISRAHLVGHSLGGAVVAAVARSTPGRVASLTLLAPAGYSADADAEYLRGFAAAATRRELKPLVGRLFADPALVTRQLVDDLLRYKRLDGVDKALSMLLGTLLDGDRQAIDTRGLLEGVDVPVTVVWGTADRILPPPDDIGERVDAGHMVHMEAANDVVRVLRAHL
jgi:pyruvate dehydrogenase E2 component (dihydrolipoamide acetyltransferase)